MAIVQDKMGSSVGEDEWEQEIVWKNESKSPRFHQDGGCPGLLMVDVGAGVGMSASRAGSNHDGGCPDVKAENGFEDLWRQKIVQ